MICFNMHKLSDNANTIFLNVNAKSKAVACVAG